MEAAGSDALQNASALVSKLLQNLVILNRLFSRSDRNICGTGGMRNPAALILPHRTVPILIGPSISGTVLSALTQVTAGASLKISSR